MDIDPNEHFDGDGDEVGSNSDYDDTKASSKPNRTTA